MGLLKAWREWQGIAAGPFSGTDSSGTSVAQFSSGVVDAVRLNGYGVGLDQMYRTQPSVRICVNFLAMNIAHLRLKSYRRTDDSPAQLRAGEHPLPTLLARPNPRLTGFDLIRGTVSDIAIYDTAYWWKQFFGDARQMYRIPPGLLQPMGGSSLTGPDYYVLTTASGQRFLSPEEIVDFSGYNPTDNRIGSPPLEALRNVLAEDIAASRHRQGYWKNAARREGVIEFPLEAPHLSDSARTRLAEDWSNRSAGEQNAGKTAILEDGARFNDSSFSPRDSEFIAGREFSLDMVATVYNIPLAVLSRKATATFASMKEFRKMLYVDTLGPYNARIEGVVWLQLIPDFDDPDLYVEFNIEEKLQGDFGESADAIRSHVQVPDMAVNESRRIQNLPRIDDPDFDVPAKPVNYLYGDDEPEVAPAAPDLEMAAGNGRKDMMAEAWREDE